MQTDIIKFIILDQLRVYTDIMDTVENVKLSQELLIEFRD